MDFKGQGVIAEIMIFGATVMMSVALLFLMTAGDDNPVKEENIEASLDAEFTNIKDESRLTHILHQNTSYTNGLENEYETSVYRLTQEYYSGSEVHIDGESYDRENVKNDLEQIFSQSFNNLEDEESVVNVTHGNEYVDVQSSDNLESSSWNTASHEIPVSGGSATITLWVGRS